MVFHKRNQLSGYENNSLVSCVGQRVIIEGGKKWTRCLLAPDESLYFFDKVKSTDGGKTFVAHKDIDINPLIAQPERAILSGDIFYALDGPTKIDLRAFTVQYAGGLMIPPGAQMVG